MTNMMAAYRLAIAAGVNLPPARFAPDIPQQYIDQVNALPALSPESLKSLDSAGGGIIMYDSVSPLGIPANAALVAAYVDGYGGYSAAVARFGVTRVISISIGNNNADVADCEPGAMTEAELPGWVSRQKARGIVRPVVYSDGSMYAGCRAAAGPSCSYWTATDSGQAGQTLPGRDAVQYLFTNSYDLSWVLPTFPFYPGSPAPVPVSAWPLQVGSTGANVIALQGDLNRWRVTMGSKFAELLVDSSFGALTKDAVATAQLYFHDTGPIGTASETPAPAGLKTASVVSTGAKATFVWEPVPGVTHYIFQLEGYQAGTWKLLVNNYLQVGTSFMHPVNPSSHYRWRVAANAPQHAWANWVEFVTA